MQKLCAIGFVFAVMILATGCTRHHVGMLADGPGQAPDAGDASMDATQAPSGALASTEAASDDTAPGLSPIGRIHFDSGSAELTATGVEEVRKVVESLNMKAAGPVRVVGHTDHVGDPDDNIDLATRRSHRVIDALVEAGIPLSRLTAVAEGEGQPIASNETETGRALNRSVEVFIVRQQ